MATSAATTSEKILDKLRREYPDAILLEWKAKRFSPLRAVVVEDPHLLSAFLTLLSVVDNNRNTRAERYDAARLCMYLCTNQEALENEGSLFSLHTMIAGDMTIRRLLRVGSSTVALSNHIPLNLAWGEMFDLVPVPIVLFADDILSREKEATQTTSEKHKSTERRIIEEGLPVKFHVPSLARILSFSAEQAEAYIEATASNDQTRIDELHQETPLGTAVLPSLLNAVQSEGFRAEMVPGPVVVKIWEIPLSLDSDVMEELTKEEMTRVFAYIWNWTKKDEWRTSFGAKTSLVGFQRSLNYSSLNDHKYRVSRPSLELTTHVSIWSLSSNRARGIALAASISDYIKMLQQEVWCHGKRHKVLFTARGTSVIKVAQIYDQDTSAHSEARTWAKKVGPCFCSTPFEDHPFSYDARRGTMQPESDRGYLMLFTWDEPFHELCNGVIESYAEKHALTAVTAVEIPTTKEPGRLRMC